MSEETTEDAGRSEWTNPTPNGRYDVVVLGAGPAGLRAVTEATALGASRVALIEKQRIGGSLYAQWTPLKGLLSAARTVADQRAMSEVGILTSNSVVDFAGLMTWIRHLRSEASDDDSLEKLRDLGVDLYLGAGRFNGRDALEVSGQALRFDRAVIAAGSRPSCAVRPELAEVGSLTTETIFHLTELPRRLAVVGAGSAGCELAQAFARLGSQVTIFEAGDRILSQDDAAAARFLEKVLRADGVEINCRSRIVEAWSNGTGKLLTIETDAEPPKKRRELKVDAILVDAGRRPNVEDLGLEAAGVAYDALGVAVDEHLRSSNHRIYVAGNICGERVSPPAAEAMAEIAIRNAFGLRRSRFEALWVPRCTYTDPEIAQVGICMPEARKQGIPSRVLVQDLAEVDRSVMPGETKGFVKLTVCERTGKILGTTIVARYASELLSELTPVTAVDVGLRMLSRQIYPYPSPRHAVRRIVQVCCRERKTPKLWGRFARSGAPVL